MSNARFSVPKPVNEPVLQYAPGSPERSKFFARLNAMKAKVVDIPMFIGGDEVRAGKKVEIRSPYDHAQLIGKYHEGGAPEAKKAVAAALKARKDWAALPFEARAGVFLKAADLLANDWRWTINAA